MDELAHTSTNTSPNRYPALFAAVQAAISERRRGACDALRILSIGCGAGDEVHTLRSLFPGGDCVIHGYDLDQSAIFEAQQANDHYPHVDFFCRSADLWSEYDVIFCLSVACVYPGPCSRFPHAQFQRLMRDIDARLAPGGFIVLYNAQYDFMELDESAGYCPIDIGRHDSGVVPKYTRFGAPIGREFWIPSLFQKDAAVACPPPTPLPTPLPTPPHSPPMT